MKVLVIGLGQLGKDIVKVFEAAHSVVALDIPDIDITSLESLENAFIVHKPHFVINAAAYTDVERAEEDEAAAYAVNADGAGLLARVAASHCIPIVLYSTDYVFDGKKGNSYLPTDATSPLNVYGASKLAGEHATASANPQHYILRTAWLYGPGGNNFVEKLIGWTRKMDTLRVVTDEVGSPTHTWDVAKATLGLIETQAYGVYHVVNRGVCSRFEFAQAILDLQGLDVRLEPCLAVEFPTKAVRPEYSVLDTGSLTQVLGAEMPEWRDALRRYIGRRDTSRS